MKIFIHHERGISCTKISRGGPATDWKRGGTFNSSCLSLPFLNAAVNELLIYVLKASHFL